MTRAPPVTLGTSAPFELPGRDVALVDSFALSLSGLVFKLPGRVLGLADSFVDPDGRPVGALVLPGRESASFCFHEGTGAESRLF